MAKYLTEFDTYAEYSGATLSLPNVSLIKSTGEVYYKNIFAGDALGDVLMYDIANDKLVTSIGGNWSAEAFPIASYTPIAVNVYPASQTPDGKNRYMAIRWASNTDSTGSKDTVRIMWGPNSTTLGDKTSTSTTEFNGRENQNKAEAAMPGTAGNTQNEWPCFYACSIFAPQGTHAGDWFMPSRKEIELYRQNYAAINNIISSIKTAAGSSYINTVYDRMRFSTEGNTIYNSWYFTNSGVAASDCGRDEHGVGTAGVRAMISI